MEYLMTYGWAILIIAVVLGSLFQLGVFNSSSFSPRAPPGACQVFRPSGPGTTTNINLMGVCTGQLPQYVAQFNGQTSYLLGGSGVGDPLHLVGSSAITIVAWVQMSGGEILVENGPVIFTTSGSPLKLSSNIYTGTWTGAANANSIVSGTWYQVTMTYDGANIKGYQNGLQEALTPKTGSLAGGGSLIIGAHSGGSSNPTSSWFNGFMSNVQVYNTSLTANQVQALYFQGIGGAPMKLQNLVAWWPLNGNANDYGGNNYNLQPYNGVSFTSQWTGGYTPP